MFQAAPGNINGHVCIMRNGSPFIRCMKLSHQYPKETMGDRYKILYRWWESKIQLVYTVEHCVLRDAQLWGLLLRLWLLYSGPEYCSHWKIVVSNAKAWPHLVWQTEWTTFETKQYSLMYYQQSKAKNAVISCIICNAFNEITRRRDFKWFTFFTYFYFMQTLVPLTKQ